MEGVAPKTYPDMYRCWEIKHESITKMVSSAKKAHLKIKTPRMDGPANMLRTLDVLFHNFKDNEVEIEHTHTFL